MCLFQKSFFEKIPIVLRCGGGGWTRSEGLLLGGPLQGRARQRDAAPVRLDPMCSDTDYKSDFAKLFETSTF